MTDRDGDTESLAALARHAADGDEQAFRALVRRTYPRVFRWALGRTGDPDDAEDVTQEVLVRLHRKLSTFTGRGSFEAWLFRMTARRAPTLAARHDRGAVQRYRAGSRRREDRWLR